MDVKAIRGADIDSDHNLVLCKVRIKLKKVRKDKTARQFDSRRLKDPAVKEAFAIELSNRFHALTDFYPEDIDEYCCQVHQTFVETSEETLGYSQNLKKTWISDDTWTLIKDRGLLKQRMLTCTDIVRQETLKEQYRNIRREIKRAVKKDKRNYLDNKASEAETAAAKGDTRTLYRITRELTGTVSAQPTVVQDKNGKILTKEAEQRERWAEHFSNLLNRPDPVTTAVIQETGREVEMKRGPITCKEIEDAIMETKGNRAPGEDRITSDMLKVDPEMSAKCLVGLFNQVWNEEAVPEAWQKGIIIKLPKKGDLTSCGNWRGINLLSVPGKIFCRVILKRIKEGVDKTLREEQAGFRPSRSCIDQIFVLRTIIEQSREWNSSLYINFIDFEKAFDSVHHTTLWNILRSYGFPGKIVNILSSFYLKNQCCVRHVGQQSEWFQVKSGVRQGCVISPLLFLVVIDWVMKSATADKPRGIKWTGFSHLEDEDFADDIALLSHSRQHMQEKTSRIESYAGQVGLKINTSKTKIMRMNTKARTDITVNGNPLENVDEFKYLGSMLTTDNNIEKEISTRIAMASAAFNKMSQIWKSQEYSVPTKLKLYKSNVRSVLLYGAETWLTNQRIESRLRGFEGRCLRRILKVRWEHRVTNVEIAARTGIDNIVDEIKRRRWRWLGHILRMNKVRHPLAALTWNPQGQRKRGRPHGSWRRTVCDERSKAGMTWNELKWLAQDRKEWRRFVGALCSHNSMQS